MLYTQHMEKLADRLRWARLQKGWTQKQLATQVGIKSSGTIGNLENGSRTGTRKLSELAAALGVSAPWLACVDNAPATSDAAFAPQPCAPASAVLLLDQQQMDLVRAWARADANGRALLRSAVSVIDQARDPAQQTQRKSQS